MVMVAAWLGGLGPGVVSAVLFTAALGYFWTDAAREPVAVTVVELALFFAIGVALSAMVESLHRARARAEAAARSRERVMEIVAHDLRNPLGAIGMSAEALQRTPTHEQDRRHLDRIAHAVARMDSLIGDLVDVTGFEHETLVVTRSREAVEPIVRETAEAFMPKAEQRHITLEVSTPPGDLTIAVDRARIVQLLGNLIGNALKFTPEGGRVALRVSQQKHEVRFEVADTGSRDPARKRPAHLRAVLEGRRSRNRAGSVHRAKHRARPPGRARGEDRARGGRDLLFHPSTRVSAAPADMPPVVGNRSRSTRRCRHHCLRRCFRRRRPASSADGHRAWRTVAAVRPPRRPLRPWERC